MSDTKVKIARKQMSDEVRIYCRQNNLFTCGSLFQYNEMLDLLIKGDPIHDIALIIWICSEPEVVSVNTIELYLVSLEKKYLKNIS